MRARRVVTNIVAASVSKLYRAFGTFMEPPSLLDQWEKDGIKHSKMRVIVENFQFLNRGQPGGTAR